MKNGGLTKKIVATGDEAQLQEEKALLEATYESEGLKLCEKASKIKGLFESSTEMAKIWDKDKYTAMNLGRIIENSQNRFKEYQTSNFLGYTPQEVIKIFKEGYPNAIVNDLFNVWSMSSVKDSFYKIESTYASTERGATAGDIVRETYDDGGRYRYSYDELALNGDGSTTVFTGTIANHPIKSFNFKVLLAGNQVGADDGSGNVVGSALNASATNVINYTTGVYTITFTTAPVAGTGNILVLTTFDGEDASLFDEVGSTLLTLFAYDFRGTWSSMKVSWHQMAEEVSQSKMGRSVRADLISGLGDVMRKNMDQYHITRGMRASNWHAAISFDADYANAGADNEESHAQKLFGTIRNAEGLAYNDLGRYPARVNILAGSEAVTYMAKLDGFQYKTGATRIGAYEVGSVANYKVFEAPSDLVATNMIYLFGKGKESVSPDAVLSTGIYRLGAGNMSQELQSANFVTEVGLGAIQDTQVIEPKFATKIQLDNLS